MLAQPLPARPSLDAWGALTREEALIRQEGDEPKNGSAKELGIRAQGAPHSSPA